MNPSLRSASDRHTEAARAARCWGALTLRDALATFPTRARIPG